jgi:hypothetical protein
MKRAAATMVSAMLVLVVADPASSQTVEGLSFRPFVLGSVQRFTAHQTFDAVFGQSVEPLFGGGLSVTQDDTSYLELTASRFKKTGQQAFLHNGEVFQLGIPMTATITPFEITAGYRFHRRPRRLPSAYRVPIRPFRFIPFAGGGVGLYRYQQTSRFATDEENVDTRHAGVILQGGVEARVHRWVGIGVEVHYSYVPGILGDGGISKDAGENDLGGIAGRFKLVIGR